MRQNYLEAGIEAIRIKSLHGTFSAGDENFRSNAGKNLAGEANLCAFASLRENKSHAKAQRRKGAVEDFIFLNIEYNGEDLQRRHGLIFHVLRASVAY